MTPHPTNAPAAGATAVEPLFRLFDVTVVATERVSPAFVRVTFGGGALDDFAWDGLDQRIKLLFPNDQGEYPAMRAKDPSWYAQWAALPDDVRPPMRTYTIRDRREGFRGAEVDVDFALHADTAGPAATWAASAAPGMPLRMLGPNARAERDHGAIGWIPPAGATRFVLAGDETALPAMAGILASIPTDAATTVFVELPHPDDLAALDVPAHVDVAYVRRDGEPGTALADAVCDAFPAAAAVPGAGFAEPDDVDIETQVLWEVPGIDPLTGGRIDGDARRASAYVWLAGEAAAIKRIRRHLVRDVGFDRQAVSFMGYWRRGRAEY
jgi:NADPH-dependent ferric siderophore reductase